MATPDGQTRDAVAAGAAPVPDVAGDPDARSSFVRMLIRDEASHTAGMIETHMSWVYLTDRHAYKLKKPVRYDYLDFSTLEARRQSCKSEIRLNRRLAPDVYLAAIPLTVTPRAACVSTAPARLSTGWSRCDACRPTR